MIVDLHTHLWDSPRQMGPSVARWLLEAMPDPVDRVDASPAEFDLAMQPVRQAVILGFVSSYLGASLSSERVARYVARNPTKYLGFGGVDPLSSTALDDLKKVVDLGLCGVVVSPAGQDFHPCATRAMRVYERCEQLRLPILVHSHTHLGRAAKLEYSRPHLLDEPARVFPKLKWIIAQVGHPWVQEAVVLLAKHPNVFADVSHLTGSSWDLYHALVSVSQHGVSGKLLFGSDFPFSTPRRAAEAVLCVNRVARGTGMPVVPNDELQGIVERDALSCLGLTGASAAA